MTESKNIINYELEQSLFEALMENFKEETKQESVLIPFIKKESDQMERKRLLRRWKNSEGYYYLNPEKFRFSLKDL